jgi:signal transduction histidine kinase
MPLRVRAGGDPITAPAGAVPARTGMATALLVVGLLGLAGLAVLGHSQWSVRLASAFAWGLIWLVVGYLAFRVRPTARLGLLMMTVGLAEVLHTYLFSLLGDSLAVKVLTTAAGFVVYAEMMVLTHMCLTYPSGRAPDRRTARFVGAAYLVAVLSAIAIGATLPPPGQARCRTEPCPSRLLPFGADPFLRELARHVVAAAWALVALAVVGYLLHRLFTAGPRERRLRGLPTVAMLVAEIVAISTTFIPAAIHGTGMFSANAVQYLPFRIAWVTAVPLVFLAGLMRERLDLARVSDLLSPLSREPLARLRPALAEALGDPRLELVLPPSPGEPVPGARAVAAVADPARRVTPVGDPDRPRALLVHDRTLADEPRLVDAVRAAVELALDRERLQTEVMKAADEARRQVERDLHDGAQAALLAAALALREARRQLAEDGSPANAALLDEADSRLHSAVTAIRELAHGIHPTTANGLVPAIRRLALRTPLPVEVRAVDGPAPRPEVESALYFVVSEALANVVKHAHADRAVVALNLRGDDLTASVTDDGRGGADPAGSGRVWPGWPIGSPRWVAR